MSRLRAREELKTDDSFDFQPLLVPIDPTDPVYASVKRASDILLSTLALVIFAPVFLLIATAVLLTSGRPVIYQQTRLGLGGCPFTLYKFRTMIPTADATLNRRRRLRLALTPDNPIVKAGEDERLLTPLGSWLRTSSLDELPQFWNVLTGSMSLVGPRPPLPQEAVVYSPLEARRLSVMPGMTGLWQVSGRSDLDFDESIALDLDYLNRRSISLDTLILVRTVPAVLSRTGAK